MSLSKLEILTGARDAITRHGWRKGAIGSESEGFCVYGAMDYAMIQRGERDYTPAFEQATDALGAAILERLPTHKRLRTRQLQIATWNDRTDTTLDDINAVLDRAIKASE